MASSRVSAITDFVSTALYALLTLITITLCVFRNFLLSLIAVGPQVAAAYITVDLATAARSLFSLPLLPVLWELF